MKKGILYLILGSMIIASKAFAGGSALEEIKALRQQQIDKETERKQASDAAKAEIADLKRQEATLIAQALKESEEQIKAKKIELSDEEKQKKSEIAALEREAADLKKSIGASSPATSKQKTSN